MPATTATQPLTEQEITDTIATLAATKKHVGELVKRAPARSFERKYLADLETALGRAVALAQDAMPHVRLAEGRGCARLGDDR